MTKRPLYACAGTRARLGIAAGVFCTLAALPAAAAAADAAAPCAACIAVSIAPDQVSALPSSLDGLDVLIRVPPGAEASALDGLAEITRRGGVAGLAIEGVPSAPVDADVMSRAHRVVFVLQSETGADAAATVFAVKLRITGARASAPQGAAIGVAGPAPLLASLLPLDLAPYVDFIVWTGAPALEAAGREVWRTLDGDAGVPATLIGAVTATMTTGVDRWLWRMPADATNVAELTAGLTRAAALLPRGLVPSPVRVACGGTPADAYMNPQTLEIVAIARACQPDAAVTVTPPAAGVDRLTLSTGDALLRVTVKDAQDRFAEGVQVVGSRALTVEEIVARHQAAAARQTAAVRELISSGTLTLSFEAPGFPAPLAISSQAIIYASGDRVELEQRAVRVNGLELKGGGVPRLPIIEPERVASPPLTITLSGLYRYSLAGRETIDGTPCYVVAFEPDAAGGVSLFRGRAWIAMDSFAMVKVAGTQTALRGPIVASEQVDRFREARPGIWLLARSDVRQTYEGAAHRTPIHRVLSIDSQEINPADFAARRQAAYASPSVMLRETPQGYRYLRKDRKGEPSASQLEPATAGRADRVRTLAAGVIIDPNISIPLPFAGLSYVDFNLFGTGTQLNAFFGGTYGQLAFSIPSVGGSRWQLAGRAFGIASSYNDRAFVGGREQYEQDIRQRPAQASVWLLRPMTNRISMRIGYDLDYTHFGAGEATAPGFGVPANQVVHAARVALDAQRKGWNASAWWSPARRSGWRPWGTPGRGDYDPAQRDFQRYGVSLVRSAVLTPRLAGRIESAWMSGRDLDRFSRYSFGAFDNRLRGYPSALIRYDRGGVVRTALGWGTSGLLRVDGFVDSAAVHDPGFGRGLRNYTGVGAAAEIPAPFGTLVALEWGYGLRGVNGDGTRGTHVVRISGFKVF